MACVPLHTGDRFLSTTLAHVDCQARTIGAYGYGALADPGSVVSIALTVLLTIFVALFGIRLLIGENIAGKDVVGGVLRIGIVLTIAASWPAWRTIGYDLVLDGPAEVASAIGIASGLPGSRADMLARLQNADDGIIALTAFGSGRLTGDVAAGTDIGDSARGIALSDQFALGMGRTIFLASTIGSSALTRLGAGILLAIAPLMAGLLFFSGTASIFFGWLRALAFCALGNAVLLVMQGMELALLYPWLGDVLQQRAARVFTPSAPTELLVLSLGFAALTAGLLVLVAKFTFLPSASSVVVKNGGASQQASTFLRRDASASAAGLMAPEGSSRAFLVSGSISQTMRREGQPEMAPRVLTPTTMAYAPPGSQPTQAQANVVGPSDSLGTSFRRTRQRASASADKRNNVR